MSKGRKLDIEAAVGTELAQRLVKQIEVTVATLEEARSVAREKRVKPEDDPEWQRLRAEEQRLAQEVRRTKIKVLERELLLGREIAEHEDEDEASRSIQDALNQVRAGWNDADDACQAREKVLEKAPAYRAAWMFDLDAREFLELLDDIAPLDRVLDNEPEEV